MSAPRLVGACLGVLWAASAGAAPGAQPDAQSLFTDAVAADLGSNGRPDPERAFALYSQAAAAGLAQAQLNAAVMLDSGRGTPHDAARAATYYALAASQGVARAAYDLGQLYADGEGVPANPDLARAWLALAASEGISAASQRIRLLAGMDAGRDTVPDTPTAPTPLLPSSGATLPAASPLQLVWTASAQPAATQFFVQVVRLQGTAANDVFTAQLDTSAVGTRLRPQSGRYAWRVFTVCQSLGRYVASPWITFSVS